MLLVGRWLLSACLRSRVSFVLVAVSSMKTSLCAGSGIIARIIPG